MMAWFGFGAWRLFLALLVAFSHLWAGMLPGPAAFAVWGFFVLSGFLMTHVLRTKYGFSPAGLGAYAANRFLRIFPAFWVACLLGAAILVWLQGQGIDARKLNPSFGLPRNSDEWGFIVTLLPAFPRWNAPVPVANALSVEVGYYLLMPLLARSRSTAWFALLFGSMLVANMGLGKESFADRYALFLPALPAFALGSLIAHYREALSSLASPKWSVSIWGAHALSWLVASDWPWTYGLYLGTVLSGWVVISLEGIREAPISRLAGELSYPVYLLHTLAGAWLLPWFGMDRPMLFAVVGVALTLLGSWCLVRWLDRPLGRLRMPAMLADRDARAGAEVVAGGGPATDASPAVAAGK